MPDTITIAVGNNKVAKSKRAVSLSLSGKSDHYDSIRWTTSDPGIFKVKFGGASTSPFRGSTSFDVSDGSPADPVLKSNPPKGTAFKYTIENSAGNTIDDPYVIIED